jgi:uncharacterized HAD superfamily protein
MRKPVLALDIDNSIADTNEALRGFLPGLDFTKYPTPGITEEVFEQNPWIFTDALPIKGAAEGVNYLSQFWEIVYLTARPKWAEGITHTWLDKHEFPKALVECSGKKTDYINKFNASLAIDDSPKEILTISELIPVCIYDQPYNKELSHIGERFVWSEDKWVSKIMAHANLSIAL